MDVPAQVQNLSVQQSDGNIYLTWSGVLGALTYQLQRSLDGVNFTNLSSPAVNQYLDPLPGIGIMYYYQVAGVNGSGTGAYSSIVQMVAAPPSEMSLYELRFRAQQASDMVNSRFVSFDEWNSFARLALYELYDLLITVYEDYGIALPILIQTNSSTSQFPIPDGVSNYLGGNYNGVSGAPAAAFYKLAGMDLAVNTSTVTPSWVTLNKYNFIDRNQFIYPNSTSTIYGVYNMRYRVMGNFINFIPVPAGNQVIRMWYAPRLKGLLQETDLTTIGISGWLRYVIARMSKYALDKEESDSSEQTEELGFLKARIEQSASNRDQGQPDTISNTRKNTGYNGMDGSGMSGGGQGGW